jgi:hypothetical protein
VKWLLDTNVVSEGIRPRPDAAVLAWTSQQAHRDVAISVVTLAELRYGASQMQRGDRQRTIENWFEAEVSQRQILALTVDVLTDWLSLARQLAVSGRPQSAPDLLIAATARVHSLVLVTRNLRNFVNTGLVLYDPWSDKTHRMAQ